MCCNILWYSQTDPHTYTNKHTLSCTHTYTHAHAQHTRHASTHMSTHTLTHTRTHERTYAHTRKCARTHTHTQAHIHTSTHTHTKQTRTVLMTYCSFNSKLYNDIFNILGSIKILLFSFVLHFVFLFYGKITEDGADLNQNDMNLSKTKIILLSNFQRCTPCRL